MSSDDNISIRNAILLHGRQLLRFLTRKVGARDAPDLAQEAMLRVMRHVDRGVVLEPAALLHSTAANLAKDYARRRRTEDRYLLQGVEIEALSSESSPESALHARESVAQLTAAINALSPRCRQVFVMRRFEGLHQEEIARRLGVSRNMVEKHMRTALKDLRKALE